MDVCVAMKQKALVVFWVHFVAVGSGVYDGGGGHGSVHQQSSGTGERWEVQGGREVIGDLFIVIGSITGRLEHENVAEQNKVAMYCSNYRKNNKENGLTMDRWNFQTLSRTD